MSPESGTMLNSSMRNLAPAPPRSLLRAPRPRAAHGWRTLLLRNLLRGVGLTVVLPLVVILIGAAAVMHGDIVHQLCWGTECLRIERVPPLSSRFNGNRATLVMRVGGSASLPNSRKLGPGYYRTTSSRHMVTLGVLGFWQDSYAAQP